MDVDYQALKQFCQTETQIKCLEAIIKEGSQRKAAIATGKNQRSIARVMASIKRNAAKHGYDPENGLDRPVSPDMGWRGTSTLFGDDGQVKLQWVKSKPGVENEAEALKEFIEGLREDIPKYKKTKKPKFASTDLMNVIVFGDLHLNMYSYSPETGADWDQEIATKQHRLAMLDMVKRIPMADVGVLATMGDLLHSDSLKDATASGTPVDVDGRLGLALNNAAILIRMMIDEMLKTHKEVKYVCVRGNHSPTLELTIAMMIRIAYENEPRVDVVDNTMKHIPLVYGKNFLLFTHGDKLNHQKKADIAVSLFRQQHGAAKFSHVLSGHVHHRDSKDVSGVLVETFPALPVPDAWHFESGYVTANRSAETVTYHKDGGISGRTITNPRFFMD